MNHIECPRCKSSRYSKDGIVRSKQRYLCLECRYHYTTKTIARAGKSINLKRQVLILFIEGFSSRQIGRFLNISHVTVQNWVKEYNDKIRDLRNQSAPGKVKLHEVESLNTPNGFMPGHWLMVGITEHEAVSYIAESHSADR
jgi:transposase-like protein